MNSNNIKSATLTSLSILDRLEAISLDNGLSRVADKFKWSKPTEIEVVGQMAELATATGDYALDDLFGPAAAE